MSKIKWLEITVAQADACAKIDAVKSGGYSVILWSIP